jgi:maltose alpha-D-glucosyltransferase/alpha-amylase
LTVEEQSLRLEFRPTSRFSNRLIKPPERVRTIENVRCHSTALVDNQYAIKLFRKLEAGINPEIEIGRFLTDVADFANMPALLGSVELAEGDRKNAIATVHAFVENQGDVWTVTSAYLDRFVEDQRLLASSEHPGKDEEQAPYLRTMAQTGKRVAEMHLALAAHDEFPDFAPEPTKAKDVRRWIAGVTAQGERVFDALKARRETAREAERSLIDSALALRPSLPDRLAALLPATIDGRNIRLHGDFHLGQILIVKDDVCITGLGSGTHRAPDQRRRKAPAARDVAELIRSIDYSAAAALERALKVAPDEHGKLAAALGEWRKRAGTAFLAAYREITKNQGLWPSNPRAAGQMLSFFLLERSFCEIEYELTHRPEWLHVPLAGMIRILSGHTDEAQ